MPSSLLEIRDWWVARELDVFAAEFIRKELLERDAALLGREVSKSEDTETFDGMDHTTLPQSDDELIARSMLARR